MMPSGPFILPIAARFGAAAAAALSVLSPPTATSAPPRSRWVLTMLASFDGNGSSNPTAGVARDAAGSLYGYTSTAPHTGDASLFRISSDRRNVTPLLTFDHRNGLDPTGDPVVDGRGNLYGTTTSSTDSGGTVFEVPAGSGTLVILAAAPPRSGIRLMSGLVRDGAGHLYAVAADGQLYGHASVFRVVREAHRLAVVCPIGSPKQGAWSAELTGDAHGNLYVTAMQDDGRHHLSAAIYRIASGSRKAERLASRATRYVEGIGSEVWSGVTADRHGNLFGTSTMGGAAGDGMVFEIPSGSHRIVVLASFARSGTGASPTGTLAIDGHGNLYGVTQEGGRTDNSSGTVFRIDAGTHRLTTLYDFDGSGGAKQAGFGPAAGVIVGDHGELYGTTRYGGPGEYGTVFELSPSPR